MTDATRPTVFCKDCKFAPRWGLVSYSECRHPQAIEFSSKYLAIGEISRLSVSIMRIERCGPDAKLWEPRR